MSGKNSAARVKDVLTEHISRDVKQLQSQYSNMSEVVDMVTNSNGHAQALCEHLDHVLLHGIRECERGYWPFVSYFTRSEAIEIIKNLSNVTTDVGRGRAWLYIALNEQAMESYIRMFIENQDVAQDYFLRESFVRDCERLLVVLTLVSGLDFINFELNVDSDYLDHSPTAPSSHMGIFRTSEFTPDIEPRFISTMTPETKLKQEQERQLQKQSSVEAPSADKSSFSISGILGSVFKGGDAAQKQATPTDHAHPPAPIVAGPAPHEISATAAAQPTVTNGAPENRQQVQKQTSVETPSTEKSSFSLSGIIGSVFKGGDAAQKKATPTNSAHPPGPIIAGPAPHEVSSNGTKEEQPSTSYEVDPDIRSSSEEPSQFHRTKIQEPVPEPESRSRSDSPSSQIPMLMSQAAKSSALLGKAGGGEEEDDIVVEGKSSRSKKQKGKRKKKKKKTSSSTATASSEGNGESSLTTEAAISAFAASRLVEEEEASKTATTTTMPTTATEREEEPPASLDDFVDTFGTGGVKAAQPMPAISSGNREEEPSKTNGGSSQPKIDDENGGGQAEAVNARESTHDYEESLEPFPSSDSVKPGSGAGSKRGSLSVEDKPLLSEFDVVSAPESDKRLEEREEIQAGEQRDSDLPLSPDFVQKDLLSEALDELDRAGGVGGGRGGVVGGATQEEEEAWQRERAGNVGNSSPESSRQHGFGDSTKQPISLDDSSSQDQFGSQSSKKNSPSEKQRLSVDKTGNSSPESRNSPISRDRNDQAAKSPLQSSSDTAIGTRKGSAPDLLTGSWSTEPRKYSSPPQRSNEITAQDKQAADITVEENMRLVFSLDVYFSTSEDVIRLVQVATPTGLGQQSIVFVLITNEAVYILRKDGTEGLFSKQLGIKYSSFDHIVDGLGGQSLILVYHQPSTPDFSGAGRDRRPQKFIIITGNEAVSRSMFSSIREASSKCPGFLRPIPLNRDDESRRDAIDKELIMKLGSNTSFEIVRYCLVHWEQLSGEAPILNMNKPNETGTMSGNLLVKSTNVLGITSWKPGFFELKNGCLYQFNSDSDRVAKNIYHLGNCGGCTRVSGESKPFTFTIRGEDNLVLSAANEEELTQWIQALCLAAVESKMVDSPTHSRKTYSFCAILLTKNKIHVLHEDWSDESVQLVTCCEITDVNIVGVDSTLPYYCTISYDSTDLQGEWLICFNSEQELGKFESALASTWREEFQIDLDFCEVTDGSVRQRAHRAVELMQSSKHRSDSVTKGRTEFTYSVNF